MAITKDELFLRYASFSWVSAVLRGVYDIENDEEVKFNLSILDSREERIKYLKKYISNSLKGSFLPPLTDSFLEELILEEFESLISGEF